MLTISKDTILSCCQMPYAKKNKLNNIFRELATILHHMINHMTLSTVSLKSDKKRQEVSRSDTKRQEDFISIIMQFYVCCIAKSIIFYMYKCLY